MEQYLPFLFPYAISFFPLAFWISVLITLTHTAEETAGLIWEEFKIPAWAYFLFQTFVLFLAFDGIVKNNHSSAQLLVLVRCGDVLYTHIIKGYAGIYTAPLLLVDALFIHSKMFWY